MSSLADGRYSLAEVLGEGGMATVYRAYDERLQVWRAIKLISDELAQDAALRERFLVEARAMARLSHPNIVAVHDIRPQGLRPFIVMEWVGGGDLEAHIRAHGALPPGQAVEVMLAVLEALDAAHDAEVIHRDIKPQNVLLTEKGVPKVGDFGIARVLGTEKLTRTGSAMGTWAYMAPEQRASGALDHRADLYAAGATLYFALTGEVPVDLFASGLDASLLEGVPESLRGVVRKACAYRPEDRYHTAEEMQAALLGLQSSLPPLPEGCPALGSQGRPSASVPEALGGETLVPGGATQIPEGPARGETLIPESGEAPGRTLIPEGLASAAPAQPKPAERWAPTEDLAAKAPGGHTLEHHTFFKGPGAPEDEDEDWNPGAGRWPLLALVAALLLIAAGVAWQLGDGGVGTEEPVAPLGEVTPLGPKPPPAEVEAPAVTPEAQPPIVDEPIAEVPTRTRSSRPKPAEPPVEPPPVSGGRYVALGDADLVLLEGLDGTRHAPGVLPSGRYTIYASFEPGALVAAGKTEIQDGQVLTLRCDSRFMLCRVE